MITKNAIAMMLAAASVMALGAGAANAVAVASITAVDASPLATFTGGPNGTFYVPTAPGTAGVAVAANTPGVFPIPAIFTFGPALTVTGPAVTTGGTTTEALSGGSFALTSGSVVDLSGTFTGSTISGILGNTSSSLLSFGATSVTYTGGTFLTTAGAKTGDIGSFSLSLSGMLPALTESAGSPAYLNAFTVGTAAHPGALSGTFDVTPAVVPEPTTIASFGFGSIGLLGLMVRAGKARRRAA